MEMLGGGDGVASQCRKPEIMADAAYVMLTKDSRSYTGNFAIDDEVLRANGITDMDQYACVPGKYMYVLHCQLYLPVSHALWTWYLCHLRFRKANPPSFLEM